MPPLDGKPLTADDVAEAVGDGVCFRSGVAAMVGDASLAGWGVDGVDLLPGSGGTGGRPPLPRPLRMDRVSLSGVWARSCWPRLTSVSARVSRSDVSSSMRLCTMCG